jgi:hypothetical protein
MKITKIAAAVLATLALAGCSGGGAKDQPAAVTEPSVSTPADSTPSPEPMGDFATAVKFTKLAHQDKFKEANALVVPESPAERYLVFQVSSNKAYEIAGVDTTNDEPPKFTPDPAAGTIKIKVAKTEDSPAYSYVWRDFVYEQGKIKSWTGKTGPVQDVLWTRTTTDSKLSTKAKLKSAYRANSGNLYAVVELSASRARGFGDAEYMAKGGYRQAVSEQNAADLSAGERTLAVFVIKGAKFGGVLHIPFYDGTGSSYGDWQLDLKIK